MTVTTKTEQHTPGPWIAVHDEEVNQYKVFGPLNQFIGRFTEPDAKLIASAPELLAVAKELIRRSQIPNGDWLRSDSPITRQARTAIAAAEGR